MPPANSRPTLSCPTCRTSRSIGSRRSSPTAWRERPDMRQGLVDDFLREVNSPEDSSVGAALTLAQVAYPRLEPAQWVGELDVMGARARQHLELGLGGHPPRRTRLRVVSEFFFGQLGFTGNREHYEEPR